jgi:DNA-binding MltR family transcriptional regulator
MNRAMAKRPVLPIEQLSAESQQMLDVLNNDSDLEAVLVATSFLDACLGSILNRQFIDSRVSKKLLEPSGALGNYSARADVCYALGLIQKPLHADLQKIAEIRNKIAHYHQALSFESDAIRKLCADLSYVMSLKNGNTSEPLFNEELILHPRNRFVITTVMINQRLLIIGLELNNS